MFSKFHSAMGQIAGLVSLLAFVPYVFAIRRGETKPNRSSWFIWTVVGSLLLVSYRTSGANYTIWVPVIYVLGPLFVFLLSIKHGVGGWTKIEQFCLIGTTVSLILWWHFKSSEIALGINLFIDFFGAIPTIKKAYYRPLEENRLAWFLIFIGNVLNMFAVESIQLWIMVYPSYMFITSLIIFVFVMRPYLVTRWQQ